MYAWLKILHVMSSAMLLGVTLGTAFYRAYINRQTDLAIICMATKQVVLADGLLAGSSGILQIVTGLGLVYSQGYLLDSLWMIGSIVGFLIAIFCWLPMLFLQIECYALIRRAVNQSKPLSSAYFRYNSYSCRLRTLAFIALVVVFFLMTDWPNENLLTYAR